MPRILLFENEVTHAETLLEAIRVSALAAGLLDLSVVWFQKAPRLDRRNPRRMPLSADSVVELYSGGQKSTHTDTTIWWQSQFDAAVLDVYDDTGSDVGRHFMGWFAFAEFEGPVVVASQRDTPVGTTPELANAWTIQKRNGWALDVASRLIQHLQARSGAFPVVGSRGRDPSDVAVLHEFFAREHRAGRRSLATWYALWIGADEDMRRSIHEFFPAMQFLDPGDWTSNSARDLRSTWPSLLAARTDYVMTWPRAVWVDLGANALLTDEVCEQVLSQVDALSRSLPKGPFHFAVFILANRARVSELARRRLRKQGVVPLSREELRVAPGLWLEDTVEGFAKHWRALVDSAKCEPAMSSPFYLGLAARTSDYFLRALLIAHSKSRLAGPSSGDKEALSPVRWFASTPHSGSRINQTIGKTTYFVKLLWNPLAANQLLDIRLRAFFADKLSR